jgi:HK97 family phage portal protein
MQTLAWSVEDVCRWLGVPPVLIGHTDKASSWASSLEQTNLHFLQYGLRPYLTRIEQAIRRCVLSPAERRVLHAEFAIEGLLRADATGRAGLFQTYITHSIATPNEIRQLENLPRSEDPNADRLQAQANMTTLERLGAMPAEPALAIPDQP